MNVDIRILNDGDLEDFVELVELFSEVFEMQNFKLPARDHLQSTLSNKDFFAVVAMVNGTMAAGMSVYRLNQYYYTKPLAYIYDLAVLPAFQRNGIGTRLINYLKTYCTAHGFAEIFVQADRVDEYALKFYRSTGITAEEDVLHYYYILT
jgi:aminoglycoside 3-N-acetyltransferase I